MKKILSIIIASALLLAGFSANAEIQVVDDMGEVIKLARPAQRIVTLSPALTENLYAAGAGEKIIGVVEFCDYPEEAKKVARVGSGASVDLETLVSMKPDLVIASKKWNRAVHVEKLRAMGFPVYVSELNNLEDIAYEIKRMGVLAGTSTVAEKVAEKYRSGLLSLKTKYGDRSSVSTFYQAWKQPLVTVGGQEFVSQIIKLCGGKSIFADQKNSAIVVNIESVLVANPEAIVASGMGEAHPEWLDDWKSWKNITAVKHDNLFFIPPWLLQRDTPRLLEGAELLCQHLERARARREHIKP